METTINIKELVAKNPNAKDEEIANALTILQTVGGAHGPRVAVFPCKRLVVDESEAEDSRGAVSTYARRSSPHYS